MSVREPLEPNTRSDNSVGDPTDPVGRMARLVKTIEGEIVPRLILARRLKVQPPDGEMGHNASPDALDVKELVRLLLAHEPGIASAYVELVRQRGASLSNICLGLLAPAARELGLLWEEDECDFMQVTVGLCRLHQVLRGLSPAFASTDWEEEDGRRVLLAAYPGEQHTFGITLVAQFLRRAAWDVDLEFPATTGDLIQMTREAHFSVVGLSVGCDVRLEGVSETIALIRKCSRNPHIGVLIGGPIFVSHPELAAALGADGTASDGQHAVRWAERVRNDNWRRASSAETWI
jgi:methanogenic corrinoid protein MtbC1